MPRKWTKIELELLSDLWPDTATKVIAERIGRGTAGCWKKANELGLQRTPEFVAALKEMQAETLRIYGVKSRFNIGMTAHNKGKKWDEFMPKESQKRSLETTYRKRNIPMNWKPIGWERTTRDGYVEVKVRDIYGVDSIKNFELKHRILWKKVNGPIPKKTKVCFKDGASKIDFTIDDLFLQTEAENLIKNTLSDGSIVKRFLKIKDEKEIDFIKENAPELIDLKRTQYKLNQKIKKYATPTKTN